MTITVKDASQLPVNSELHLDKQYLVYMTQEILDIPPALLSPYLEGDATYLLNLGSELNTYSQLCVDIEYLTSSPDTIIWYFDSPTYRAGAVAGLVDWVSKFRASGAGYTGDLGIYSCTPDFVEYARKKLNGGYSQAAIDAEYALAYQYAVDIADLANVVDTLYPSLYMSSYGPGEVNEMTFDARMAMFTLAAQTTLSVLSTLYPTKRIEPFITNTDLDARINALDTLGYTAVNVWSAADDSFSAAEIDILNSYGDLGVSQSSQDFYYHMVNDWPGNPNASLEPSNYLICQRSGFRVSVAEGLKKEWTGLFVRDADFDVRHPQDFVRVRVERQTGSYSPELPDNFISRLEAGSFYLEDGDALLLEDGDGLSYEAA